ncbi:MAG: uracil-DNA glycosylase [Pseudomonadota bacterium]
MGREARLRELGLWPVWRLRAAPAAAEGTAAPAPEGDAAEAEPAPAPLIRRGDASIARMDWDELKRAVASCTRCALHEGRTQAVFGTGDRHARWLVIGEAPGEKEDLQGEPFVGPSGMLLDAMLAAVGLKRGEGVYIANVVKSRPPSNRDPVPSEVAACLPYLERQIELIRPRIILALGRFAAQSLLMTDTPIGRLRGHVHEYHGVPMVVTYHPAYLLRNPPDKAKVWEDLLLARRTLAAQPQPEA